MRLHILSDIHDDYGRASGAGYELPGDLAADAILIAGDIAGRLSRAGLTWLLRQRDRTGLPIVITPGNHDYWNSSLDLEAGRFRDRLGSEGGIHLLNAEEIVLGDTRIVGATLWTDYAITGDAGAARARGEKVMLDFRYIRAHGYERRLHAWMLADEHARHLRYIDERLAAPFAGTTVVMTHHAPSRRSLRAGRPDILDASYASDLDDLIRTRTPDFWIHGHVHSRHDYQLGGTRVLANPRGYTKLATRRFERDETENTAFDPRLVLDTEDLRPLVSAANIEHAVEDPSHYQWPAGSGS